MTNYAYISPDYHNQERISGLADWCFPIDLDDFKSKGMDILNKSDEWLESEFIYKIEAKKMPDPSVNMDQIYLSDLIYFDETDGFHRRWEFYKNTGEIVMEEAEILEANRFTRNRLLLITDYTQGSDTPLNDAKKTEWATYRQALRDLPTNLETFNSAILAEDDLPTQPS
jgi:hypothetical protein